MTIASPADIPAPSKVLDRVLVLEMVRVTEAAAIAASTLVGRGDEKAADAAAVAAMREAAAKGMKTVAFSLLSSGIFRGGRDLSAVLRIALLAVGAHAYAGLEEVSFIAFTQQEADTLLAEAEALLGGGGLASPSALAPVVPRPRFATVGLRSDLHCHCVAVGRDRTCIRGLLTALGVKAPCSSPSQFEPSVMHVRLQRLSRPLLHDSKALEVRGYTRRP